MICSPNYKYHTTERHFSQQVEDLLNIFQWRWCHFRPARTQHGWRTALSGYQGFPDYIAIRKHRILIFELKTDRRSSKLTPDQARWLWNLRKVPGLEVYIWRPRHLETRIVEILR